MEISYKLQVAELYGNFGTFYDLERFYSVLWCFCAEFVVPSALFQLAPPFRRGFLLRRSQSSIQP